MAPGRLIAALDLYAASQVSIFLDASGEAVEQSESSAGRVRHAPRPSLLNIDDDYLASNAAEAQVRAFSVLGDVLFLAPAPWHSS